MCIDIRRSGVHFLKCSRVLFDMVVSVRTDVCRCNLCWKDEMTLIIGWAKSVKVFDVILVDILIGLLYVLSCVV